MRLLRGLALSTRALFAHKVRTTLALASVAVGVAAVVVTGAIGTGAEKEVLHQTESMGTNFLVVRPAKIKSSASRKQIRGVVTNLKLEDYEAIRKLAPIEEPVPGARKRSDRKSRRRSHVGHGAGNDLSLYRGRAASACNGGRFLDGEKIRTVLRNVFENAAKYSLPNSNPVEIFAEQNR
jgi:hypothetical protein